MRKSSKKTNNIEQYFIMRKEANTNSEYNYISGPFNSEFSAFSSLEKDHEHEHTDPDEVYYILKVIETYVITKPELKRVF